MDLTKSLTNTLKSAGMRMTKQRVAICSLLAESHEHPTAAQIYEELHPLFPSLSLATVYNTVETLVRLGVVNSLGGAGGTAVHYDANTQPHINLACTACHRIIDLDSKYVALMDEEVVKRSGYQLAGARVVYYGLCPDCQQMNQQGS